MRAAPLVLLLLAVPARADDADDRITVATIHGGISVAVPTGQDQGGYADPYAVSDLRGTISFEHAQLPYREPRGYNWRGALVPEILAGAMFTDGDSRAYVGGGLRLQADFSQRRMGIFEVSARGDFYFAGRAGLVADDDHTPFGEGAFGEAFWIGGTRVGFEGTMREIFAKSYDLGQPVPGALARVPWENGNGHYLTVGLALTLGTTF